MQPATQDILLIMNTEKQNYENENGSGTSQMDISRQGRARNGLN